MGDTGCNESGCVCLQHRGRILSHRYWSLKNVQDSLGDRHNPQLPVFDDKILLFEECVSLCRESSLEISSCSIHVYWNPRTVFRLVLYRAQDNTLSSYLVVFLVYTHKFMSLHVTCTWYIMFSVTVSAVFCGSSLSQTLKKKLKR
jgi:hypothetical protein